MPGAQSKLGAVFNQGSWHKAPKPGLTPATSSVTSKCKMSTRSPHGMPGIWRTAPAVGLFDSTFKLQQMRVSAKQQKVIKNVGMNQLANPLTQC
eukprot:1158650-Pelagomonas_calceolata.AAC.1